MRRRCQEPVTPPQISPNVFSQVIHPLHKDWRRVVTGIFEKILRPDVCRRRQLSGIYRVAGGFCANTAVFVACMNPENSTENGFLEPFSATIPTSMLLGNWAAMDSVSIH